MWGLPQKQNARRADKIRLCGHLRRYKKIVKKTYIIYIPNMKNIQGKAGLFGGKFSFNYEGQEYKFKLPSKAGKFVDFFVK